MSDSVPAPPASSGRALSYVLAGALALMLPAFANGFPLLFFDTLHYYAGGEKLVSLLTAHLPAPAPAAPLLAPPAPEPSSADPESGRGLMSYMGGRSPYYSLPLFLLARLGASAPAFAQALIGAWLVFLTCRAFGLGLRAYALVIAGLTALSVLPFMAVFLMPDVFGGYAILAAALLMLAPARLGVWERRALLALLAGAAAFHTLNLLLLVIAAPLALLIMIVQRRPRGAIMRALTPLAIAIPLAAAATLAYPIAAKAALGKPLPQPPFLMARLLADGPGRAYLREACAAGDAYTLCRFKDHKLDNGDTILWSLDPRQGVYRASSWDTQQLLIAEQTRFAVAVVTHKPLQTARAALANWGRQLASFGADGLLNDAPGWRAAAAAGALDDTLIGFIASPAGKGAWTLRALSELHTLAVAAAALFLLYRLTRGDLRRTPEARAFLAVAVFTLALVAINAAIAGALSGVFARYQARVIWLAPLLALVAIARYGLTPAPARVPGRAAP